MIYLLEDNERLLTTAAIAEMIDAHRDTILDLMREGKLPKPCSKIGNTYRWRRTDLLLWMAEGCPTTDRMEFLIKTRRENIEREWWLQLRRAVAMSANSAPQSRAEFAVPTEPLNQTVRETQPCP